MRKNLLLVLPFLACLAAACSKNNDKVIAKVGPEKITESYLKQKLEEIAPNAQSYLATKPGKKQFLDVLINEKLMLLAAKKSDAARSVDYKKRVTLMETELKEKLQYYKDYVLAKMWVETLREGPIKVTPAEIDDYYAKYPYEITMEHIILPTYEEAEAVIKKVKSGADFSKTAREKSMDKDNVRLPPVIYGEFMPELEEMAFKMRPGEVQGIVKTTLGYHILKKAAQTKLDPSSSKERIRRVLEKKKFDAYLAKFQAKVKVEVLNEDYK
ncbi:MAG: peptidylprolyl isomerase [Elusimicrobia bacterium]|nr:peptidylprolyl isomerase [Elusimicrobiota bacterium]